MHELLLYLFGVEELLNLEDFLKLFSRLVLDVGFTAIVVRGFYMRRPGNNDQVFTYFAFNVVTFSLTFLLRKVPVELGFALGLFAVFGILRYRTEAIRIRDLTYLFVVIGLAILNAVANKEVSLVELLSINAAIVVTVGLLEMKQSEASVETKTLQYDNIALLQPGRSTELAADLKKRTGLDVVRVHIDHIDLLKDTAAVRVECRPSPIEIHTA